MYATASARECRLEVLLDAIRDIQLASLVVSSADGLTASHLPMAIATRARVQFLQCHVARANPLWTQIEDACSGRAIFQGPHAYVDPNWFVSDAGKRASVPTWTYIAVHVHGKLAAVDDEAWLIRHLAELARNNEAGRPNPWSPSKLPADAKASLLKNIVGIELTIDRIEGSWKMAQGLPEADRRAVIRALEASDRSLERDVAAVMRDLLKAEERHMPRD